MDMLNGDDHDDEPPDGMMMHEAEINPTHPPLHRPRHQHQHQHRERHRRRSQPLPSSETSNPQVHTRKRHSLKQKRRVRPIHHSFASSDQAATDNNNIPSTPSNGTKSSHTGSDMSLSVTRHPHEAHTPGPVDALRPSATSSACPVYHCPPRSCTDVPETKPSPIVSMMHVDVTGRPISYADARMLDAPHTPSAPIPIPPMMHIPYQLPFFANWNMPTMTSPNPSFATTVPYEDQFNINEIYNTDTPLHNVDSPRRASPCGRLPLSSSEDETMLDELLFTAKDLPETVRMEHETPPLASNPAVEHL